jgi:hypothetical protein
MAQAIRNGVIVGPTLAHHWEAILWIAFLALYFLHQYSFRDHRNPLTLSFVEVQNMAKTEVKSTG